MDPSDPAPPRRPPGTVRLAAVLVGLQAVAVLTAAGWGVTALIAGDVAAPGVAGAMVVALLAGAAVLLLLTRALGRGSGFARGSLVAWNLLVLATGAAVGQASGLIGVWLSALVPAAAVVALFAPATLRHVTRPDPEPAD